MHPRHHADTQFEDDIHDMGGEPFNAIDAAAAAEMERRLEEEAAQAEALEEERWLWSVDYR